MRKGSSFDEDALLATLAGGEFCSGQTLADALGVSRTAVWKHLGRLSELGLDVESVRGRGYRIPGGLDLLNPQSVRDSMDTQALPLMRELEVVSTIDSTNSELMRRAGSGAETGMVLAAEQQSAGRGRRNRPWISPFAGSLYFSVLWEFSDGIAALEGLSLAVGVAMARALQRADLPPVSLKWPNDIVAGEAKLGGVLLEIAGDASGPCRVVVGVGVNVRMPAASAAAIDQRWTDLATLSGESPPGRNRLLGLMLSELLPILSQYQSRGFRHWRAAWQALDAFAGRQVVIQSGAQNLSGIASGVSERGALLLETPGGTQPIFGGEVSLRAGAAD